MQCVDGRWVYSASDLNNFLECEHLTALDRLAALHELEPPERSASAELIAAKGMEHERRYLEGLREAHGDVVEIAEPDARIAAEQTTAAMERGPRIIYQGTFFDGHFVGRSDFLIRVERPCERWGWSYEVVDTKLALHAKPYYLIQLAHYSEHLARVQGTPPLHMHVVLGSGERKAYRVAEFDAYYRHLKAAFLTAAARLSEGEGASYPLKVNHCTVCRWNEHCFKRRIGDDHLSLVANMRRDQIARFNQSGIATVAELAAAQEPARPGGMNPQTFAKLRRQAAMQVRGRTEGPVYEFIDHEPWAGFGLLPEPAEGDVFFDMEGDPLYEPTRGLEYLFGCWLPDESPSFKAFWALDRGEERRAFEAFVDFVVDRRKRYPGMHVYHYADYEKSALRRLAQYHATRELQVDDLLRDEVFVDLYAVVRQSLVISESSYSIKRLERFYAFERATDVKKGDDSIVMFERWLQDRSRREILDDIERYNEDDCRSTLLLRDWLLRRREDAIAQRGIELPFRQSRQPCHAELTEGCKKCDARRKTENEERQTSDLQRRLLARDGDRGAHLLAHLLAYHRREEKPVWWAFFDRCDNVDKLIEFDKDALGGLELCEEAAPYKRNPGDKNLVYTYRFPEQHYNLGSGEIADPATQKSAGSIVRIDDDSNVIEIKRAGSREDAKRLRAVIPGGPFRTDEQKASLQRIGQAYLEGRLPETHPATRDLLFGSPPRVAGTATIQPEEVSAESVSAVVQALDRSYVFIQGPPGSGKSTIGSQVICDLLAAGKRVGVMSNGHKAIHNLLRKVETCAQERGVEFRGLYKFSKQNEGSQYESKLEAPLIRSEDSNLPFEEGGYDLAAGTSWLFARDALTGSFDYLFIDEAGQVSLADALAVSACAKNVVLLGDPLQLAQVSQGSHPAGAGVSVLEHLLGDSLTVPEDRGIFLDVSYRMHPDICRFISESMYCGRLRAAPEAALHHVDSPGLDGAGLRYLPMQHSGNARSSPEEADRIVREIALLLAGSVRADQIIVVTPYNAQRRLIAKKLHDAGIDVRVGTVDKFQGQEAMVVFYSMATSSGADVPRDVEFLFEKNRFNVAVSRARALSVVVASKKLTEIRCSTVNQMSTVSLLCRYIESCPAPRHVESPAEANSAP